MGKTIRSKKEKLLILVYYFIYLLYTHLLFVIYLFFILIELFIFKNIYKYRIWINQLLYNSWFTSLQDYVSNFAYEY